MAKSSQTPSDPLTFDLPESLISKLGTLKKGHGLKSASEVVRLAIENFNFAKYVSSTPKHRQISVRVSAAQRKVLKQSAKKSNVSVGELLRAAIESLPAKSAKK